MFSFKSGGGTCLKCDACNAYITNSDSYVVQRAEVAAKRTAYEKLTSGDTVDLSGTTVNLTTSRLVRSILTLACSR